MAAERYFNAAYFDARSTSTFINLSTMSPASFNLDVIKDFGIDPLGSRCLMITAVVFDVSSAVGLRYQPEILNIVREGFGIS